jgi:hypothetical protein
MADVAAITIATKQYGFEQPGFATGGASCCGLGGCSGCDYTIVTAQTIVCVTTSTFEIIVPVKDDHKYEEDETLSLELVRADGGIILHSPVQNVTVVDDGDINFTFERQTLTLLEGDSTEIKIIRKAKPGAQVKCFVEYGRDGSKGLLGYALVHIDYEEIPPTTLFFDLNTEVLSFTLTTIDNEFYAPSTDIPLKLTMKGAGGPDAGSCAVVATKTNTNCAAATTSATCAAASIPGNACVFTGGGKVHILPDTAIVKIIDDGDAGVVAITSAACIVNETAVWSGLPDVKSLNTFTDLHNVHCIESAGTMGVLFTVERFNGTGGSVTVSYRTKSRTTGCAVYGAKNGSLEALPCDDAKTGSDFLELVDLSVTFDEGEAKTQFRIFFYEDS